MMKAQQLNSLPVLPMAGIDFYIDIANGEFREVGNPSNVISMDELTDVCHVSGLAFNLITHNICEDIIDPANLPADVRLVIIPPLSELALMGSASIKQASAHEQSIQTKGRRI